MPSTHTASLPACREKAGSPISHVQADVARSDYVSCGLSDPVGEVAEAVQRSGQELCFVVADGNVLMGRVRRSALGTDTARLIEDVMVSGPATIRPDVLLGSITDRMKVRNVMTLPVTTPEGRRIGTLSLEEALRRIEQAPDREEAEETDRCHCDL